MTTPLPHPHDPSACLLPIANCNQWLALSTHRVAALSGHSISLAADGYPRLHVGYGDVYLHRLVTGCPDDLDVHHEHGLLDCRDESLRIVSRAEHHRLHQLARGPRPGYRYKGLTRVGPNDRWLVQIRVAGKLHKSRSYSTIEEAALAYNAMALDLLGPDCYLNEV